MATMTRQTSKATERETAITELRELLSPGAMVYTILKHRADSGMSRVVDLYVIQDNQPRRITWSASKATGYAYNNRHEGLTVQGCGTDVGFEAVYNLSHALYPDGFTCIGRGEHHADRCPSNDHSNGDRDYTPHQHANGGYALRHRWL